MRWKVLAQGLLDHDAIQCSLLERGGAQARTLETAVLRLRAWWLFAFLYRIVILSSKMALWSISLQECGSRECFALAHAGPFPAEPLPETRARCSCLERPHFPSRWRFGASACRQSWIVFIFRVYAQVFLFTAQPGLPTIHTSRVCAVPPGAP